MEIEVQGIEQNSVGDNCISTQTPNFDEFVEVETILETSTRRSVQTQTDPRLKKKKLDPVNHDAGIDAMDFDEYEDEVYRPRRVKKYDDDYGLFEDSEPRRKSIRRNIEEALKCPFCEKAFIGLVKHIKGKHRDEHNYEEEMRNAKWRERIMKVRLKFLVSYLLVNGVIFNSYAFVFRTSIFTSWPVICYSCHI